MNKNLKARKTPAQITTGMIRAAMSAQRVTIDELAKLTHVC